MSIKYCPLKPSIMNLITLYVTLYFAKQFIIYFDITVWRSANQYFSIPIQHIINMEFKLPQRSFLSKMFQFQNIRSNRINSINLLQTDQNMRIPNINKHIIFQSRFSSLHLLKNPKTNPQILYQISFTLHIKPDLKMPSLILFSQLTISKRYYKIIDHNLLIIVFNSVVIPENASLRIRCSEVCESV
jgi:hypothetical protein